MTTTECSDGVTLVFNHTPLWILCGIVGAFILLSLVIHVREWLEERSERKAAEERKPEEREITLHAAPRREALELIAKLSAVREKMSELDRALTRRREGVGWRFGIGDFPRRGELAQKVRAGRGSAADFSRESRRRVPNFRGQILSHAKASRQPETNTSSGKDL